MDAPKIIATLRLKNEERWIRKTLESVSDICDEIVILDDGSTDNTIKICKEFDKVVDIKHQENLPIHPPRDLNTVWQMALKRHPDFVLHIDGDEVIQSGSKKILLEDITILHPDAMVYEFQFFQIWDKPNQYRSDGVHDSIWIKRLVRIKGQPQNLYFDKIWKFHPQVIPINCIGTGMAVRSRVKIFHYGKYDNESRYRKYKFNTTIDPVNEEFDNYLHVISGKGKLSGPNGIELKTLPDGIFIEGIE